MKTRLITNGVLSIITTILWIIAFISFYKYATKTYDSIVDAANGASLKIFKVESDIIFSLWIAHLVFFLTWIINLVMGILTLSMRKHEDAKGLTIASGILAILGGLLITNAIISFIAAYRIFNAEKVEEVAAQNIS